MNVTAFQEYAKDILETALKHNKLDQFIMGSSFYGLSVGDGYGGKVQATNTMVITLYNKYKETNDNGLIKAIEKAMIKILRNELYEPKIEQVLLALSFHLEEESYGRAPFKLNYELILKEAEKNLVRNIKRYSYPSPIRPKGFIGTVEEINKSYQRYGYSMQIPAKVET